MKEGLRQRVGRLQEDLHRRDSRERRPRERPPGRHLVCQLLAIYSRFIGLKKRGQ